MLGSCQVAPERPRRIQLPRSSTRLQLPEVYVKILRSIKPEPFGCAAFDGPIHRPGALIEIEALPRPTVAIECIGPLGAWQRGKKRDFGYILWRFDFSRFEWIEIARAQALDASWTAAFREPAMRALYPRPELIDITRRGRDLADELIAAIDEKLLPEKGDVRKTVLNALYERVAGRIADCA